MPLSNRDRIQAVIAAREDPGFQGSLVDYLQNVSAAVDATQVVPIENQYNYEDDSIYGPQPGTIREDKRGFVRRAADAATRAYRQNVPESFRTIVPGFSDVEDVAYLREQFGPEGTLKGKVLAAGMLALPIVGSKVIKALPTKFKKGDKFYRGVTTSPDSKFSKWDISAPPKSLSPEQLLDPAERIGLRLPSDDLPDILPRVRISDDLAPNSFVTYKRQVAERFADAAPEVKKAKMNRKVGLIGEYSLQNPRPYVVSDIEAKKYLDSKFGVGKYNEFESASELRKQGVDVIYSESYDLSHEEAGLQFLNNTDLKLEKAIERHILSEKDWAVSEKRIRKHGGYI